MVNHSMQIQQALAQILSSPSFAKAQRPSAFLRYVVEKSLNGDEDRIKAYCIGLDVYQRDEDFDPQHDNIVRINAGRVRKKLAEYYADNENAAIKIVLPPRCYVPQFIINPEVSANSQVTADATINDLIEPVQTNGSKNQFIFKSQRLMAAAIVIGFGLLLGFNQLYNQLSSQSSSHRPDSQLLAQHLATYQQMLLDDKQTNVSSIHGKIALILMDQKNYQQAKWHVEQSLVNDKGNIVTARK